MNLPFITLGTRRLGSRLLNKTPPAAFASPSPRYLNCRSPVGAIRMASTLPKLPVFEAISRHDPESTVVVHSNSGRTFKYGELLGDVCKTRNRLYETAGKEDLDGERIAFLVENSYDYVGKPVIYLRPCPAIAFERSKITNM